MPLSSVSAVIGGSGSVGSAMGMATSGAASPLGAKKGVKPAKCGFYVNVSALCETDTFILKFTTVGVLISQT